MIDLHCQTSEGLKAEGIIDVAGSFWRFLFNRKIVAQVYMKFDNYEWTGFEAVFDRSPEFLLGQNEVGYDREKRKPIYDRFVQFRGVGFTITPYPIISSQDYCVKYTGPLPFHFVCQKVLEKRGVKSKALLKTLLRVNPFTFGVEGFYKLHKHKESENYFSKPLGQRKKFGRIDHCKADIEYNIEAEIQSGNIVIELEVNNESRFYKQTVREIEEKFSRKQLDVYKSF